VNAKMRKQMGLKATVNDLVADSIERECSTMMNPPLSITRMEAEALAFVAVRRLRRADRQTGWVGRRVIAKIECGIVPAGHRGVIRMASSKRLIIHWEGRGPDMVDKKLFKRMAFFAGAH
jgi:hypothetical protein